MVYEKLCALLADQLGVNAADIRPETNIVEDLGADSLDVVELITALEDAFNILITDDRARELYTVQQLTDFIEAMKEN